ncbi:hypothetical protein BEWA_004590 [Theileria equi strain WA]|uniref:Uncharacterized protein n=1 Tax=Theileria equi strain WA TaxID=1537102 RepID=L0B1C6_THEEQ|nr:hypothetical protein BEWA_004590 [Theileria equi strain WA]AFZ81051.1 hypothetical protein BEWA_004590 [Theileria equi strain WA]|eukprot:XP_004830717.1 hypothetical protein BEWA_004590 [Theileria equi strain WA]
MAPYKKEMQRYKSPNELYHSFTIDLDCTVISYWLKENHCSVELTRPYDNKEYVEVKHAPKNCDKYLVTKVVLNDEIILDKANLPSEPITEFSAYYSHSDPNLRNPLLLVLTKTVSNLDLFLLKKKEIVKIYYFRDKQGKWYGYTLDSIYSIYYFFGIEFDKKETKLNNFTGNIMRTLNQCNGRLFTLFYVEKDGFDVRDFCYPKQGPYERYCREFKEHNEHEDPPINFYPGTAHVTPRDENVHVDHSAETARVGVAGAFKHPDDEIMTVTTYEESSISRKIHAAQRTLEVVEGAMAGLVLMLLFTISMYHLSKAVHRKV